MDCGSREDRFHVYTLEDKFDLNLTKRFRFFEEILNEQRILNAN